MNNETTRGFVTIATGQRWYYTMAMNLLKSYRQTTKNPLPFAIIADEENDITGSFDKTIRIADPTNSYMDKLFLGEYLPYDETIFIDADCLAYADLNGLFDIFREESDVSCFGITEPLADENQGWFSLQSFSQASSEGKILTRSQAMSKLPYSVGMHGGLLYMRRTELTRRVFQNARELAAHYGAYRFRLFRKPADEPVLALAMALHRCQPIPYERFDMTCYWTEKRLRLNFFKQRAFRRDGHPIKLLHWGTRHTKTPIYKKQIDQMNMKINGTKGLPVFLANLRNNYYILRFHLGRKLKSRK